MPRWLVVLVRFIVHRRTRYVLSWVAALGLTALQWHIAWHMFDSPPNGDPTTERRDRNFGHTLIDFGGQWLPARVLITGHGHELYSPEVHRQIVDAAYPRSDEPPQAKSSDADLLYHAMMEVPADDGDGRELHGPLYPPTQALLFAPLGKLPPREGYRVAQGLALALGWVSGLALTGISRFRIWWPVASAFIMVFPGFTPALHLAQNSSLTLAILLLGWWCVSRGWEGAGGVVWGLLAFKPVWAAAFILVPLLTRRWRMLFAMTATGLALVLITLPFVGIECWFDWFRIGRAAADLYKIDDNWIFLSRDLFGIPRRWLLDFQLEKMTRDRPIAELTGWLLWGTIVATTAVVSWRCRLRAVDGYAAAFVGLGAMLSCYRFIYYDFTVAAFPVALLLTHPERFMTPTLLVAAAAPPELAGFVAPRPLVGLPAPTKIPVPLRSIAVLNSFVLTAIALLILNEQAIGPLDIQASVTIGRLAREAVPQPLRIATGSYGTPWDTFILLALWIYCGTRILVGLGDKSNP
jgi:arabinofuranan 3-O-arabinosyltransferase